MAIKILIYLAFFIVLFVLYVHVVETKSVFYPSRYVENTPKQFNIDYEDIFFKTKDNIILNGWFIKKSSNAPTVLFFHGNAGNISHRIGKISMFKDLGLNVFVIDYRGYGNSEGNPSEKGIYADALASYDYLVGRDDINKEKIIIYGASLGGAVAIDLAGKKKPAALIVDSSFTSAADMAKKILPFVPAFLIKTKLDSIDKIKNVDAPKLFIHSIDDEIIPYEMGMRLYNAASQPKEFLKINGDHNEGYSLSEDKYVRGIKEFLENLKLI